MNQSMRGNYIWSLDMVLCTILSKEKVWYGLVLYLRVTRSSGIFELNHSMLLMMIAIGNMVHNHIDMIKSCFEIALSVFFWCFMWWLFAFLSGVIYLCSVETMKFLMIFQKISYTFWVFFFIMKIGRKLRLSTYFFILFSIFKHKNNPLMCWNLKSLVWERGES